MRIWNGLASPFGPKDPVRRDAVRVDDLPFRHVDDRVGDVTGAALRQGVMATMVAVERTSHSQAPTSPSLSSS